MRLIKTSYLYFLAPFPLFWDLKSWFFFVNKPTDIYKLWLEKPSVLIPLVFLVTLAILILGLVQKRKTLRLVSAANFKVSVLGLLLIGTIFGLNGVGVMTFVQTTLPIWLLCLLACQSNALDTIECLSFFTIVAIYALLKYSKTRVLSLVLIVSVTSLGIMSQTRLFMVDLALISLF